MEEREMNGGEEEDGGRGAVLGVERGGSGGGADTIEEEANDPFSRRNSDDDVDGSAYWYSSDDDSVYDAGPSVFARSLRAAADHLERGRGVPIGRLFISHGRDDDDDWHDMFRWGTSQYDDEEIARDNNLRQFRRFVAALGRKAGEGNRVVRHMELKWVLWDGMPEEDVMRLCQDVLPRHPTLQSLSTDMPPKYVTILANSLQADSLFPLRKVTFLESVDRNAAQSIAEMVLRNFRLTNLVFQEALLAADCKIICEAVSRSPNLRELRLAAVDEVGGDTLEDVVASSSSLRQLSLNSRRFSDEFVASFCRQLRTNTTLERLTLTKPLDYCGKEASAQLLGPIATVLETYNVTLRTVKFHSSIGPPPEKTEAARILRKYRRRNRRIRRAIEQLKTRNYHLVSTSAWPDVMAVVSSLPTLLYRFMRKGCVNAMCHPPPPAPPGTHAVGAKKRGRDDNDEDQNEE